MYASAVARWYRSFEFVLSLIGVAPRFAARDSTH